jgi:hypothetical protein
MKKTLKISFVAFLALALIMGCFSFAGFSDLKTDASASDLPAQFDNPVIRTDADGNTFFTADPSVRVFNGKLYMYPSHDVFPANRCSTMDNYHVFSSSNGQDWKDEGQILSSWDLNWGFKGGWMWAPDCEYINGKYYFFYPHLRTQEENNDWITAVAVSDTPVGPFKDLGPIEGTGGQGLIDPNILKVSDDEVYIYWGGSQKLYASKITCNGDNVALTGGTTELTNQLSNFHEGSWCFEKDGTYYMTYARSNGDNTESLGYATGPSPLGPFTYKGIMLSPNPGTNMDTSHGCVTNYEGTWLIFYHNMAISGFECLRSVCCDYLHFNGDGTIQTVTPAANTAPPVNTTAPTNAQIYPVSSAWQVGNDGTGEASATLENGDTNVGNLHMVGAYAQVSGIDGGQNGGKARLWFRYSGQGDYAALIPTVNGTKYDAAPAAPNGSWNDFRCYTSTVINLNPGNNNTIRINGGYGGVNFNAIYIEMLPDEPEVPDPVEYDLYMSAVSPATTALNNGDSSKFAVTLRNLSDANISNADVKVNFYCDGVLFETVTKTVSINSNGFTIIQSDSQKNFFFGSHSVKATVSFADENVAYDTITNNNLSKARFKVTDN